MRLRSRLLPSLGLVSLVVGACSKPPAAPPVPGDIQYSLSVHLPAGAEQFQCQYVTTPAAQRYLVGAAHKYTPGSHHLLLYRTDLTAIPDGQSGIQDCYEGAGGTIMSHTRGVVYGSQVPADSYTYPTGIAMPLAASEVLLLQAHYINATEKPVDAQVYVGLTTDGDASKVQHFAGTLFYYDVFIDVPPMAKATAGERCTLTHDITLLNAYSHYHSRGYGYQAYLDEAGQAPATTPFYVSADWSNPTKYTGAALELKAGTAIRWNCDYENNTTNEYFQGPSAANNEMCMFTGLYYPAVDTDFEECLTSFDRFGQGATTCQDTTSCIGACPPVTQAANASQTDIPDCWQKCIVASCPNVSAQLLAEIQCFGANCASCSATGDCTQCVVQHCANLIGACTAASCS